MTTNNALEGYNGRMKDMVFGKGRMRRSALWCLDRYVFAMSLVRDQIGTRFDGTEDVNMMEDGVETHANGRGLLVRASPRSQPQVFGRNESAQRSESLFRKTHCTLGPRILRGGAAHGAYIEGPRHKPDRC